jgi:hypothetical protein
MKARLAVTLVLMAGCGWAKEDTVVVARLKAELKDAHPYVVPVAKEGEAESVDEPVLKLEKMVVTISPAFAVDVLAEARRAAAVREAARFSLRKGGTLFSSYRGDIGFWPAIVPVDDTPWKRKGDVGIRVDLLRLKW